MRRLDRLNRRLWCHFLGCQPSWIIGLGCGLTRPICARCGRRYL